MLGLALLGAQACDEAPRLTLRDTEGRVFQAVCRPNEACQIGQSDDGTATMSLFGPGRVVSICPHTEPVQAWQCRPLVCQKDTECPPAVGLDRGACVSGLCIEPSHPVVTDDAVVLCLAGTGLGKSSRLQVERYAMALQCGDPCAVPKPCRRL